MRHQVIHRLPLRLVSGRGLPDNGIDAVDGQAGVLSEYLLGGRFGSEIAEDRRRQDARARTTGSRS